MSSGASAFPLIGSDGAGLAAVAVPMARGHTVQFYDDDRFLIESVGRFVTAGLQNGDRVLVFATASHRADLESYLACRGGGPAVASGQLVCVDARTTLARFMVDEMPDPGLFREVLSRTLEQLRLTGDGHVRAYGEMVDLLCRDGNARAAIRLEELWNEANQAYGCSLLCSYVMSNFYTHGDGAQFMAVCRNHSHVLPTESYARLDEPQARLREIAVLQQRAHALEAELVVRTRLEDALRTALRDRERAEAAVRAGAEREQAAVARAEASDAFKEMFLGILGHDLRNPLNTIMTAVDLMIIQGILPETINKRLERISASGTRMKLMIDQLLDLARARLGGFPVELFEQPVLPMVLKIAREVRTAHPSRTIDVHADPGCRARLDGDRFEQVLSNLVGNAVVHGDPERPITITVEQRGKILGVCVHNHGVPIPPAVQLELFDPFTRSNQPRRASDGRGLGLYISERIIAAHGGKIDVRSARDAGTAFEILLPAS